MNQTPHLPRAEVTVFSPLLSPTRHKLTTPTISVGRAADCSVPIKDRYLSRKHAEIVLLEGAWNIRDCGSANGTYLNGSRLERPSALRTGDRIRLGDTEIVFQSQETTDRFVAIESAAKISATIAIPIKEIDQANKESDKSRDRLRILNSLAMELIEDRPLDQLFGFIADRVMEHLRPSRAAIGLLGPDGKSFESVEVRREDESDESEVTISQTLLTEVVEERKALAFMNVLVDEKLSRAQSIIMQGIRSVLCAPMMVGDVVVGVLYVDYQFAQTEISEDDVRLVAQVGRFAAMKIENTRLREDALQKRLMDEELKTASLIQRRLLPDRPPELENYSFAGLNRPCRTVSGDYYDFVVRPNGKVYFVIGDVSGKGVTAALLMAGLQTAFRIFAKSDPAPNELVARLNVTLKENLPQSKFVTLFAGRLDVTSGQVEFSNAGHNPPLWITRHGFAELSETDLVLGLRLGSRYQNQTLHLSPGDSLVLFTDGIPEAENGEGDEFGMARVGEVIAGLHGENAEKIADTIEHAVLDYAAEQHLGDDVTLLIVSRNP